MSNSEMREVLKAYYKTSSSWTQKVNKMTDGQVVAIYLKWKKDNKI
jgi:hypothetical protein